MDQQKILRLLRLLLLLSGKRRYTNAELQERFELGERSVYRYLESFEKAGLILDRSENGYRLKQESSPTRSLQHLMHFTEEEVYILEDITGRIEGDSHIKKQLLRKLNSLYDMKVLELKKQSNDHVKIQHLNNAIRDKKQVQLIAYRSSNSAVISDRRVEPFDFLPDYEGYWCYEIESAQCKQFRLARMKQVELLQHDWQHEKDHQLPFTDAFRMSADKPKAEVEAILDLKAYNLLLEEYPLTKKYISPWQKKYCLKIPVADYQGIGRFVLGLPGSIQIIGTEAFREFIRERMNIFFA